VFVVLGVVGVLIDVPNDLNVSSVARAIGMRLGGDLGVSASQGFTARAGFHVGGVEPARLRSAKPATKMALTGSPLI
jgi:hypothetical protein